MHVFISYSRKDSRFAEQLRTALIDRGYDADLDREDIAPGEPWLARLDALITAADAVVYVISPDSLRSPHCVWEVERSRELKKTLTPLMWRADDEIAVPESLASLNYVFFDAYERSGMTDASAFEASLAKLEAALSVADVLWVREHTKWVGRAVEWDHAARTQGQLLPVAHIAAIQAWATAGSASEIPAVLTDYLAASIAEVERERHEKTFSEQKLDRQTQIGVAALAQQSREAQRFDAALRLALAGETDTDIPEPARRAHIAASAHASACTARLAGHSENLSSVAISADGARIVTASADNTARIWDTHTGATLAVLHHDDGVMDAAFSPDRSLVATACQDKLARIWRSADGALLFTLSGHVDMVKSVAFDPTGTLLLTSSADCTARLWNVALGSERARLKGHGGAVVAAVFSADGRKLVTCSDDESARIWSVKGGLLRRLNGHTGRVWAAAFSADGSQIVTASADQTARVWDTASGKERAVLHGHTSVVTSVAFDASGRQIATGSRDRTARVWDVLTGDRANALCSAHWMGRERGFPPGAARAW